MTPDRERRLASGSLTVLLAVAVLACGEDGAKAPPAPGLDLLARRPTELLDEPGELHVDPVEGWGEAALGGWAKETVRSAGGEAVGCAARGSAALDLSVLDVRDRALELELWIDAAGGAKRRQGIVTARLGDGAELARLRVTATPATHRIEVPAEHWRPGSNRLELALENGPGGRSRGRRLVLSRIAWGHPRLAALDARRRELTLDPGTGVRYELELLAPTRLELHGRSRGEGRLEARLRPVDPLTGRADDSPTAVLLPVDGGVVSETLPVGESAGERVELELRWVPSAGGTGSRLVLDRLALVEDRPAARPPIVFLSIDTLSARHLSLYGYERETTPNLEVFAKDAIVFERARANAPFTVQSYMSQFTGLFPPANRVSDPSGAPDEPFLWHDRLAEERWTLAEVLRAAGYRTAAWIDNPWLARDLGWEQGFELYDTSASEAPNEIRNPVGGIDTLAPLAEEWITARGTTPFFAFIQVLDPHGPYLPSEEFAGRFAGDEHFVERTVPAGPERLHVYGCVPEYVARGPYPEGEIPDRLEAGGLVAAYDEKIAQTDDRIGRFLDALKECGVYDRALILIGADHGESLLDHDFFFDHGTLYDEVLHVPLLVRLPGGARAGTRCADPVQLVDLYPTILEAIEIPPWDGLHGRSLFPAEPRSPAPVLGECGIMKQACVVHDGWKLIRFEPLVSALQTRLSHPRLDREWLAEVAPELAGAPRSRTEILVWMERHPLAAVELRAGVEERLLGPIVELYRIDEDPLEQHDLSASHPEEVAELGALLDELLQRGKRARADVGPDPGRDELDRDARRQLNDLGYVDAPDPEDEDR